MPKKLNYITLKATEAAQEIFQQDCQLQNKTTDRYTHFLKIGD